MTKSAVRRLRRTGLILAIVLVSVGVGRNEPARATGDARSLKFAGSPISAWRQGIANLQAARGTVVGESSVSTVNAEPPPIPFGDSSTDFPIPLDFDGDGKADIAVYRAGLAEGDPSSFMIKRSSDGVVLTIQLGQFGDDGTVSGDYDGDGKADPAVFSCPATVPGQCFFRYRPSTQNYSTIVSVPWGSGLRNSSDLGTLAIPVPGDYDGDGKYDFCVYKQLSPGVWQFQLLKSSNSQTEMITFGNFATDYVVPGDYDGDGRTDFMLARTGASSSTPMQWSLLTRTGGGTGGTPITFGLSSDTPIIGDYDGDGKADIGVVRQGATTGAPNTFLVRKSTDLTTLTSTFGVRGDFTLATWQTR